MCAVVWFSDHAPSCGRERNCSPDPAVSLRASASFIYPEVSAYYRRQVWSRQSWSFEETSEYRKCTCGVVCLLLFWAWWGIFQVSDMFPSCCAAVRWVCSCSFRLKAPEECVTAAHRPTAPPRKLQLRYLSCVFLLCLRNFSTWGKKTPHKTKQKSECSPESVQDEKESKTSQ